MLFSAHKICPYVQKKSLRILFWTIAQLRFRYTPVLLLIFSLSFVSVVTSAQTHESAQTGSQEFNTQGTEEVPEMVLHASATVEPTEIDSGQTATLKVDLHLVDGYKAYEDQFRIKILEPEGFKVGNFKINPTTEFYDKFSKKNRIGVAGHATLTAAIEAPENLNTDKLRLSVTYQACTESFCLFPREVTFPVQIKLKSNSSEPSPKPDGWLKMNFQDLAKKGLPLTFLFMFLFGILTSFTPCHFPMIPITIAVLGKDAHVRTRWQNIAVSHVYVLGIATTYSALGVLAASTGALFGSYINHPAVTLLVAGVFIAMSLSLFGFYELQAPQFIRDGWMGKFHRDGYLGAFFSGIIAGAIASPCVGPILVGVLTFVAQSQNLWLGFWLLFVYALGMGQLYLLLGIFSGLAKKLPKSGPWMDSVSRAFGLILLGAAAYYLTNLVPPKFVQLGFGLALVALSVAWGAFRLVQNSTGFQKFRKMSLLALCSVGLITVGQAGMQILRPEGAQDSSTEVHSKLQWQVYSEQLIAEAKAAGKPVLIDFYADWCAACKELESKTFTAPEVEELAQKFVLLRFDATDESEQLTELKKKYGIVGLPTIIFLDSSGVWRKDLTLTEFEEPAKFAQRLRSF